MLSNEEVTLEAPVSIEPDVEVAQEPPKAPIPTATGNGKIAVLRHEFIGVNMERDQEYPTARLELAIRNVSDTTIATAIFEAVFYGKEGNVVDTIKHREVELPPETSRAVQLTTSIPVYEYDLIQTYQVRLVRTTTADVEKLQFRRQEWQMAETGEEQVSGVVKNISQVKCDAAVVATFHDANMEVICTRVLVLKDMEPSAVRLFELKFRPDEGDGVSSCGLAVGAIVN